MKLGKMSKKIVAAVLAAATALTALTVSAFADDDDFAVPVDNVVIKEDDPISEPGVGIEVLPIKNGVKKKVVLPYTEMYNAGLGWVPAFHENGYNYIQFRYNAPSDGELEIEISSAIGVTEIKVFKEDDPSKFATLAKRIDKISGTTDGSRTGIDYSSNKNCYIWNKDKEVYSGTLVFKVTKGNNIIQIARAGLDPNNDDFISSLGNGTITIKATMKTATKLSAPSFAKKVTITWNKVKNATGYKFQYSTDKKTWKTITVKGTSAAMPIVSGKTYYYKVAAKNSAKTGSFSKVYSIKIG